MLCTDSFEMVFSSIPSTTLKKRLTLDPSVSLNFGAGLPEDTILFQEQPWVTIKADQAEFASTVTFSGYLKYNFWGFKVGFSSLISLATLGGYMLFEYQNDADRLSSSTSTLMSTPSSLQTSP